MTRDDLWIFAKTIWAEACGEPIEGQIAVANVILNRARQGGWWGDDIAEVCCKPKQFTLWGSTNSLYNVMSYAQRCAWLNRV